MRGRHHLNVKSVKKCECSSNTTYTLRKHTANVHEEKESTKCPMCDTKYVSMTGLKQHIESVHEAKKHKCPHCDGLFSLNSTLTKHIYSIHEEKKHKCSLCDATFSQKNSVSIHFISVHGEKKIHSCQICIIQFKSKNG